MAGPRAVQQPRCIVLLTLQAFKSCLRDTCGEITGRAARAEGFRGDEHRDYNDRGLRIEAGGLPADERREPDAGAIA